MTSMAVRALPAVVAVIAVAAGCEPAATRPPVGSQNPNSSVTETISLADTVTREDTNLWEHRPNEKRGVRVELGIPAGMDSVVIKRANADAEPDADSVEFIEVNSVRVLAPSELRRIAVRSADGNAMHVELIVRLGHCTRLNLDAVTYSVGGPATGHVQQLTQPHGLPDCCEPPSAAAAADGTALGEHARIARPTHESRERQPGENVPRNRLEQIRYEGGSGSAPRLSRRVLPGSLEEAGKAVRSAIGRKEA